jgi:hypothetical protein
MTRTPFEPHDDPDEESAAADPGRGAPEQAPGFGVTTEEPDRLPERPEEADDETAGEPPD